EVLLIDERAVVLVFERAPTVEVVADVQRDNTNPRAERLDVVAVPYTVPGARECLVDCVGSGFGVADDERDRDDEFRILVDTETLERLPVAPPAQCSHGFLVYCHTGQFGRVTCVTPAGCPPRRSSGTRCRARSG